MSLLQETLYEIRRLTGRMKLYPKNNPPTSYSVTIYTYNGGYFVSYNGYDLSVLTDNPTDSMITFRCRHDLSKILSDDEEFKSRLDELIKALKL